MRRSRGTAQVIQKEQLAKRRQQAVGSTIASQAGLSVLQSNAVAASTAKEYGEVFHRMSEWFVASLGAEPQSEPLMDQALVMMLDEWFLEGEKLPMGRKALAALPFFRPVFARGAGCGITQTSPCSPATSARASSIRACRASARLSSCSRVRGVASK